ncbi:hypothetical protein CYMTET_40863 [Cymbomonas tetramitiformis]|uniref:Uncharacterized protein n=1 Tax=Cymbomonas tetramitiformis TaxID=36881 RepID=A0AAE0C7B6_9CHLO|nr:hypothetical protein CYMTET_40863 [Cymbomonas tetramitiformis]
MLQSGRNTVGLCFHVSQSRICCGKSVIIASAQRPAPRKGSLKLQRMMRSRKRKGIPSPPQNDKPEDTDDSRREIQNDAGQQGPHVGTHIRTLEEDDSCSLPRSIAVFSECTGESTMHLIRSCLRRLDFCSKPQNLRLHSFVTKAEQVATAVAEAAAENSIIVANINTIECQEQLRRSCTENSIPYLLLAEDLMSTLEKYLGAHRSRIPLGDPRRSVSLSQDYFRMIAAVEFTIKQDDGACPENLKYADMVIVGVSRTSKTALCTYLMHRGYKVANVPIVPQVPAAKELYEEVDQRRIVALNLSPLSLSSMRQKRAGTSLGVESDFTYSKMDQVKKELRQAEAMYRERGWPIVDVTAAAVEETAERIIEVWEERVGVRAESTPAMMGSLLLNRDQSSEQLLTDFPHRGGGDATQETVRSPAEAREYNDECHHRKHILILSECSGESAAHTVRAALGQFEHCIHDLCRTAMTVCRKMTTEAQVEARVREAHAEGLLIVYSFTNPSLRAKVQEVCALLGVTSIDLWGDLMDLMGANMAKRHGQPLAERQGGPLAAPQHRGLIPMSQDFFQVMEAIEYSIRLDDGAGNHKHLKDAHLVLVGVSRSSKTPLSMYLAQRGYRVANVPLVPGIPPPKELFEAPDQSRVVALHIGIRRLRDVRIQRLERLGIPKTTSYVNIGEMRAEIAMVEELCEANTQWCQVDVTDRAIEESAALILKQMTLRNANLPPPILPQWSRYTTIVPTTFHPAGESYILNKEAQECHPSGVDSSTDEWL